MQVFRQSNRQKLLAISFCLIVLLFVNGSLYTGAKSGHSTAVT